MSQVAKLVRVSLVVRVIVDVNATEQQIMELAVPKLSETLMDSPYQHIDEIVNDTECPFVEGEDEDEFRKNINIISKGITVKCFNNEYTVRHSFDKSIGLGFLEVKNSVGEHIGSIVDKELPDLENAGDVDNFNQMFENWLVENEK